MILSRTANTSIQLVSTVILARLLTPEDFGLVTMVTAFSLLLYNVGLNGFTEAIIQKEDLTPQQVSTIFWIGLALSTGLAVLFSAFSPLLAVFYHEPRVIPITIIISTGFIFSALATEHLALIMRTMQFHKIMANELISAVLSVILAVWMAQKGYGYWAIVARQLSIPVFGATLAWFQCSWRPGRPVRDSAVRPMIKYAMHTFGNFATSYFGQNVDKILLGWRWGSQELGNYDRAYRLAVMPVEQIPVPLGGVALASLSRLRRDPDKYRTYFLKSLSLMSKIGMLISVIMTISGRDIILLLLGPQWGKSGEIFTFFGPSIGIAMIYRTHGWLHLSLGNANRWFKWGIWAFAFQGLAFLIGLKFGAIGMAVAYGVAQFLLAGPGLMYAAKPIGIPLQRIWQSVWREMAAGLLVGLTAWISVHHIGFLIDFMTRLPTVFRIALVSAIASVLYGVTLCGLHRSALPVREMARMAKMFIPGAASTDSPESRTTEDSQ
jgi:O-antigen/teichoic acid export membrane protein